jgi:hypothetical protein
MTELELLEILLPETGTYFACSYGEEIIDGEKKPYKYQKKVKTLEELLEKAWAQNRLGYQSYMAMAGFNGSNRRFQENVVAVRSLWLDVDCAKPRASYATLRAGHDALGEFLQKSNLPNPFIICSGRGLHVYWPFICDVEPSYWKCLALALKACVSKFGLEVDPPRTMDEASVMRVPGTWNYFEGDKAPVYLMEAGEVSDPDDLWVILGAEEVTSPLTYDQAA